VSDRRFAAGDVFRMSGVDFRVVPGSKPGNGKHPAHDLVIQWFTPGGWVSIGMDALALIVDFLYENEDELYPPPGHPNALDWTNYRGGKKVRDFIGLAINHGHGHAIRHLNYEKENKMSSLFGGAA
jgi:hypothetical protein